MPRIPYVDPEELPERYESIERIGADLPDGVDSSFWNDQPTVRTFSNNPELGEAHVRMNTELWTETGLSREELESVILAIARAIGSEYEWHDHAIAAVERTELSEGTIRSIATEELGALADPERLLVEYAFAYVENAGEVGDDLHERVAERYDDGTVAGLAMLAGYYVSLAHVLRALGIELEEEFVGWQLENYA